jgi:hypothetical protein
MIRGKVLGVMFDSIYTTDLTWRLSDNKLNKAKLVVKKAMSSETCSLKEWQKLMGRLNDISQMCPFLKSFRQPINKCVSKIPSNAAPLTPVKISHEAKEDLQIWANFLSSDFKWLPISKELSAPPIWRKEFVSDAAGLSESADIRSGPGCGNVGFKEDGTIVFAHQLIWPRDFIEKATEDSNIRFGDKTTTLEVIGLLMPFVLVPEEFKQSHVVVKVDCPGAVFGMENRFSRGDVCASIFIRAIYLIAAYLECTLYVEHLPRMSDWGAEVTDRLSRLSTTTRQDNNLLRAFKPRPLPVCLVNWLQNPTEDWGIAAELLNHVKNLV